jgi:protein-S-isoprenylcysteine O-methyltransferase Ste14
MQYLEQQLADFKAEFARRRKRQLLVSIPLAAVVILFAVFSRTAETPRLGLPPAVLGVTVFVLVLGAIAFSLWNWRCPACNKYLGKGISPSFCPKCGVPLQ